MKFESKNGTIIYCKDDYFEELNNKDFSWYYGVSYYKGYLIHKEDGPAIEYYSGWQEWYLNGKLHREDGPAVKYNDKGKEWHLNGERYTEEEYFNIINLKKKDRVLYDI